mmetsp:Transcript_5522/g.11721  ORF Transcript_5522/g.11721 Transcript_5522/m.11721 type:complete len:408 (-) Transcript_5522:412-1635(-)
MTMRNLLLLILSLAPAESFLSPTVLQSSTRRHLSHESTSCRSASRGLFDFDKDENDASDETSNSSLNNNNNNQRRRRQSRRRPHQLSPERRQRLEREKDRESRFLSGDELQQLRQQVMDLRHELQVSPSQSRQRELEQTILKAQQMDAEFIYQVATERAEAAEQEGQVMDAARYRQEALHARAALPQFNLEGLWVGKFNEGFEIINCTYRGDTLIATKVTGDRNVPKGEASFTVDLSPLADGGSLQGSSKQQNLFEQDEAVGALFPSNIGGGAPQPLEPIELNQEAAEQWGSRFLQRFQGMGQAASRDFRNAQWMEGQLILVGTSYFSFAWLPIGHQVFFGRPSAEMTLKLLRESKKQEEMEQSDERVHLQRCWEETELLEDDLEVGESMFHSHEQQDYYTMEGCFE